METYPLFKLQTEGDTGWAHARALATGSAELGLALNRGIDLSAGLDLRAEVGVETAGRIQALLKGGARATAGISFQAAMPLDLFRAAGFVARMRAQAAAGAYLHVRLSLESDVLADTVRRALDAPWDELVAIMLSELRVGAELMGNAQVSAQLVGEAAVAGSLIDHGSEKAGFTCSFQYAMGYYYGAGFIFRAHYGLEQPGRLLDRLGNQLAVIVERELDRLPPAERAAAAPARPLVRFAIPLVLRLLYEQGVALADGDAGRQAAARAAMARAVIRESQELVAGLLFDLALAQAQKILGSPAAVRLDSLADDQRERAIDALLRLRSVLAQLARPGLRASEWVAGAGQLLMALADLTTLVPSDQRDAWDDSLALAWAAAVVSERLLAWYGQGHDAQALDPTAPAGIPPSARIAARVAEQIGRPDSLTLTVGSAVAYLVSRQNLLLQQLRDATPEVAPALDLLAALADPGGVERILASLYTTLATPEGPAADDLLARLATALSPALEQLVGAALEPLIATSRGFLQELLRDVVRPALLVTARRILPGALAVNDERGAALLREQISSVLLRLFAGFLLEATKVIADFAVTEGPPEFHAFAEEIRDGLGGPRLNQVLFLLSPAFGIPPELAPSRQDVARMLKLCAATLERWGDPALDHRRKWFAAANELIRLGFAVGDADMERLWNELAATNQRQAPPSYLARLEYAALLLKDSLWDLLQFLTPRLGDLFVQHMAELPQRVVEAFDQGVRDVVRAARAAEELIKNRLGELEGQIEALRVQIANAIARIRAELQALAAWLDQRMPQAIAALNEAGWTVVRQSLELDPVFRLLPGPARETVASGVRAVYNAVFTASTLPLTEPLRMFRLASDWVNEGLSLGVQSHNLSPETVLAHVRARAQSLLAPPLPIQIRYRLPPITVPIFGDIGSQVIDLGVIMLPGAGIAGLLVDFLLSDEVLGHAVARAVADQQQITADTIELTLLEERQRSAQAEGDIYSALQGLTTGERLVLELIDPPEGQVYEGRAPLRVVLRGANRSYLGSVLGIPPRVRISVNGVTHAYAAGSWRDQDGALVYEANLLPPGADVVPLPVLPAHRVIEIDLGAGQQLRPLAGNGLRRGFTVVPVGAEPAPTPAEPSPPEPVQPAPAPVIPIVPPGLTPVFPISPRPRPIVLGDGMTSVRWAPPILDPLTGVLLPSAPEQPTPVVLQPMGAFAATAAEQLRGVRWAPAGDVIGGVVGGEAIRETIDVRTGFNHVEVVVVDGEEGQVVVATRTFLIQNGA